MISALLLTVLMPEMSYTGEKHGQPQPVGGFDDLRIALRPPRLNDCSSSGLCDFFDAIGKREESVGGGYGSLQRQLSLHCSDLGPIDAAHLSRPNPDGLTVARVDDGVGLHVLADLPGVQHGAHFFRSGDTLGDN